jgi:hypothetical protein
MSRTLKVEHSRGKTGFFVETRLAWRLLHRTGLLCTARDMPSQDRGRCLNRQHTAPMAVIKNAATQPILPKFSSLFCWPAF